MKRAILFLCFLPFMAVTLAGCAAPLIIGGAAGVAGAYAASKDNIEGDTDKPYDILWDAALTASRAEGKIKLEDSARGYLELQTDKVQVWIRLIRMTRATTRLRVSARKHHLPDMALAQRIFMRIMGQ